MFVHAELNDSSEADLVRTIKAPPESTSTAGFLELNADDQASSPIPSQIPCVGMDPLIREMQFV